MKNSIKRAQSRAGSSFAERENFRPKVKHLKKHLMMTLALLLTAATSAWAESKPIGLNVEYEVGDVITSTTDVYVYYGEQPSTSKQMAVKITSTQPLKISIINAYSFGCDGAPAVYYMADGNATGGSAGSIPCFGESTGDATVVHVARGSGTLTDPYVFGSGPSGNAFPITWSATTPNTASIAAMPAGNVTVKVKYFAQAELATSTGETPELLAPAAIADVPANTDAPIVTAGTVANIGTSEVKQGTLKYFVKQADGNTAPTAPTYDTDGWSDKVPTADGLAQGDVYVWYYIEGAEPAQGTGRTDDNTRSDSDIMPLGSTGFVTLAAEPTYTVSLNKTDLAEGEPALWKAKSTNVAEVNLGEADLEGVKKSETVTVTYSGSKKIIGVKAEKKAAKMEITVTDSEHSVKLDVTGCTKWDDIVAKNTGKILIDDVLDLIVMYYDHSYYIANDNTGDTVTPDTVFDPSATYTWHQSGGY